MEIKLSNVLSLVPIIVVATGAIFSYASLDAMAEENAEDIEEVSEQVEKIEEEVDELQQQMTTLSPSLRSASPYLLTL